MEPSLTTSRPTVTYRIQAPSLILVITMIVYAGGTSWIAQALLAGLMGLYYLILPPKRGLGRGADICVLLFTLWLLLSFLPIGHTLQDMGWVRAAKALDIIIPPTLTFQPYVTLQCMGVFLAFMAWLYAQASLPIDPEHRKMLVTTFGILITLMGIAVIYGHVKGIAYAFAPNAEGFSFFSNRNQTALVLCMGACVLFASALVPFKKNIFIRLLDLAACLILFVAILYTGSRASVVLFFAGALLWIVGLLFSCPHSTATRVSVSFMLLFFGGLVASQLTVLERFLNSFNNTQGSFFGLRMPVYQKGLEMSMDNPVAGVGLGNFQYTFLQYWKDTGLYNNPIHPESDWIWLMSETGVIGVFIGICFVLFLLKPLIPMPMSSRYRAVCTLGLGIFLLHTLMDVSAHRLGTAMLAGWLYSMSYSSRMARPAIPFHRWLGRLVGVVLIGFAVYWSLFNGHPQRVSAHTAAIVESEKPKEAKVQALDAAIHKMPLAWQYYFSRGRLHLESGDATLLARDDFRRARFLEPVSEQIPLVEGELWLPINGIYATTAWREALIRPQKYPYRNFKRMMGMAKEYPAAQQYLLELTYLRPAYRFTYLQGQIFEAYDEALGQDLAKDPLLEWYPMPHRDVLFFRWNEMGYTDEVIQHFEKYPILKDRHWQAYSMALADEGIVREALFYAFNHLKEPDMPNIILEDPPAIAKARMYQEPDDVLNILALFQYQINQAKWDDALKTSEALLNQDDLPDWALYWVAKVNLLNNRYGPAWTALSRTELLKP